ncbi:hypothetical protein [Georgenia sp. AZ-5]|uniref:hypothetical protein n=1 Tax=Georgenia sp. AZ-5 TaxID=3367526 RepID=UPI0037542F4A
MLARTALCSWWFNHACAFGRSWFGPAQAELLAETSRWVDQLEHLLASDANPRQLASVLTRLWPLWSALGRMEWAAQHLDALLERDDHDPDERFQACWALAWLALALNDVARADAAIATASASPPATVAAGAALDQICGIRSLYAGNPQAAGALLRRALDHHVDAGPDSDVFLDLSFLAAAASCEGDLPTAYDLCERAVALCERHGERWLRNYVLWALALAAWRDGDRNRAYVLALDGVDIAASGGDQHAGAICLEIVAWYEAHGGDATTAAELLGVADGIRVATRIPTLYLGAEEFQGHAREEAGVGRPPEVSGYPFLGATRLPAVWDV